MPTDSESTKKAAERSSGTASQSRKGDDEKRTKKAPVEAPVDDLEDEDEDDEEEDAPRARPRSSSAPVARSAIPKTEAALDTPNTQTLWMLGAISISTLIMWGFGRAACNLHPPRESRKPRVVGTQELARDPKNAAIELQQRWAVHKYGSAMELASGAIADELRRKATQCEAQGDACQKEQVQLAADVKTVGDLLRRDLSTAVVRVTTYGPGSTQEKYLINLESAGTIWKAKSREKDIGQPLPPMSAAPAPADAPSPTRPMPPPMQPAPGAIGTPPPQGTPAP